MFPMKPTVYLPLILAFALFACGTPDSEFGVYKQSDGAIGITPKTLLERYPPVKKK